MLPKATRKALRNERCGGQSLAFDIIAVRGKFFFWGRCLRLLAERCLSARQPARHPKKRIFPGQYWLSIHDYPKKDCGRDSNHPASKNIKRKMKAGNHSRQAD